MNLVAFLHWVPNWQKSALRIETRGWADNLNTSGRVQNMEVRGFSMMHGIFIPRHRRNSLIVNRVKMLPTLTFSKFAALRLSSPRGCWFERRGGGHPRRARLTD
eukprot:6859787-Pyramimonas_sp.AAC.1